MAELAMAAFSAVSSVFSAAAPTALTAVETASAVASAGAGAASWAAGTTVSAAPTLASSLMSGLQGAMSIGSSISTLISGVAGMQQSNAQARFAEIDAEGERLAAEEKALRIRRELVQKTGATRVAFAASGVDISGGYGIEDDLSQQAGYETGLTLAAGRMAQAAGGLRAEQYRTQGVSKLVAAAVAAGSQDAKTKIDFLNRG